MTQYVGLDVSLKETKLHVLDEAGNRVWRGRCATDPAAIAATVRRYAPSAAGPQSVTAAIFWLKTRAGWKDTVTPELGKKAQAEMAARAVSNDAEWGDDLHNEMVH
jgi:hypothetical protein